MDTMLGLMILLQHLVGLLSGSQLVPAPEPVRREPPSGADESLHPFVSSSVAADWMTPPLYVRSLAAALDAAPWARANRGSGLAHANSSGGRATAAPPGAAHKFARVAARFVTTLTRHDCRVAGCRVDR